MKDLYALLARLINWIGFPVKVWVIKNSKRVRVLIIADNSVLLLRSSIGSQIWSLPGGGVEKNEAAVAAAVREVKEEAGLELDAKLFKDLGEVQRNIKWTNYQFYARFYAVELPKIAPAKIVRPFEILEVKWMKLSNLPENRSSTVDLALTLRGKPKH